MTAGPGDIVKVRYLGRDRPVRNRQGDTLSVERDEVNPLHLMWDSKPYMIQVGTETHIPFDLAANAFGDPRSAENMASFRNERGETGFILDRATEIRRLRAMYDNQLGNEGEITFAPNVQVHDLEGNTITTVLDDPTGQSVLPSQTTLLDRDALLAQVQRQQRMIEILAQQQGIDLSNPSLTAQEPEIDPETGEPILPPPTPVDDESEPSELPEDDA